MLVLVKGKAILLFLAVLVISAQLPSYSFAVVRVEPWWWANGTIVDDDGDGSPDLLDDNFDGSGKESWGVQLTYDAATNDLSSESRVFFEYKLNSVSFDPPVLARLNFTLKGSTVFGVNGNVQLYSYPSDLVATLADYSGAPAVLQGAVSVVAYQPETAYSLCVSDAVDVALASGAAGIGFRFQIDPASEAALNHAHVVAYDGDAVIPTIKPELSIALLGDANDDDVVDLVDFNAIAVCLKGPGASTSPLCRSLDLDCDGHTDLFDFARFQASFTGTP